MDARKFTEKSIAAIGDAQALAGEYGNQEVGQAHLLYALVSQKEGLIPSLLSKMKVDVQGMQKGVLSTLEKLPKVQGGDRYVGQNLSKALEEAAKQAEQMGDSFVSVEHLFLRLFLFG